MIRRPLTDGQLAAAVTRDLRGCSRPLARERVEDVIRAIRDYERRPVPVAVTDDEATDIIARAAFGAGLTSLDVTGNRIDRKASDARAVAAWVLVDRGMTPAAAGRALGGRHRYAVQQAVAKVERMIAADSGLAARLRGLAVGDELAARRAVAG